MYSDFSLTEIFKAIEKGEITVGLFMDFSKAIDIVDHNISLSKLEFYGIYDALLVIGYTLIWMIESSMCVIMIQIWN